MKIYQKMMTNQMMKIQIMNQLTIQMKVNKRLKHRHQLQGEKVAGL
jgi:hypothetical protein